jgi:Kunitz/Bovine pancreatic trypsin inhibitor domain/WAP-type (Whey Acidic Protein) 'four-disulfide core'
LSLLDSIPSRCTDPEYKGTCFEDETKYYFDTTTKQCRSFLYGGCNGNGNRFYSLLECRRYCQSKENYKRCIKLEGECKRIRCQHGVIRSTDSTTECEKCECYNPCAGIVCSKGSRCIVEEAIVNSIIEHIPKCGVIVKPGSCPNAIKFSKCISTCNDDLDCSGNFKCCQVGCAKICHSAGFPATIIKIQYTDNSVYESTTLKCSATGVPKPTITWARSGTQVN